MAAAKVSTKTAMSESHIEPLQLEGSPHFPLSNEQAVQQTRKKWLHHNAIPFVRASHVPYEDLGEGRQPGVMPGRCSHRSSLNAVRCLLFSACFPPRLVTVSSKTGSRHDVLGRYGRLLVFERRSSLTYVANNSHLKRARYADGDGGLRSEEIKTISGIDRMADHIPRSGYVRPVVPATRAGWCLGLQVGAAHWALSSIHVSAMLINSHNHATNDTRTNQPTLASDGTMEIISAVLNADRWFGCSFSQRRCSLFPRSPRHPRYTLLQAGPCSTCCRLRFHFVIPAP